MADLALALHDMLNEHDLPLADAIDRHFGLDYRQRTDGAWDDRAGFVDHMTHLRTIVEHVQVDVLDELSDGDRWAERHVVTITKKDRSQVVQEVYVFAELSTDGRFRCLEERTLMLSGAEADRAIGSARG